MPPHEKKGVQLSVEEEPLSSQDFEAEKTKFPDSLIVFAKHKLLIASIVGGVVILSIVVSLLLPKFYTATARILPPQQSQSVASAMLSQLGGLGSLLGAGVGKDLGIHNPNDMYVAMLRSESVTYSLVDRFELLSVYHVKLRADARKILENATQVSAGKDGIISVTVEDRNPRRAADIANAYIDELGKLTKTLAVTDATKRRIFFEHEAKSASDELAGAEQAMKQTEEKTGVIELGSQARVMFEAYAELRAAVTAKEVEIQAMRSFATPDNPDLVRAQHELEALQTQVAHYEHGQGGRPIGDIALEKVPARALEYLQKFREVKYREAVLEMMLKQFEVARIDESKDYSLIQVLDRSLPPERRSWPKRTAIVLASTILASILALVAALVAEKIQRAKEDPRFMAQVQLFKFYLRHRQKP